MRQWHRWGLLLCTWLAFGLRLRGLFANSFHADEALFASWARHIAVWQDPLLLTQTVDKPPLLFYLQALFYPLQGPVEWAARLPNFIASLCLVPLTAVLYRRLYGDKRGALVAAFILSCSPLAVQFSATAFTDPLLTFWLTASFAFIWPTPGRRPIPFLSGLFFGLAVATKHQAWLFLPLVWGWGWLAGAGRRQWGWWLAGWLPVWTAVLWWEAARTGGFSLWSAQAANAGGLRLAWSWELGPRLAAWGALWTTAVPGLLLPALGLCGVWLAWRAFREERVKNKVDLLLLLFIVGYMALHGLTAVPIWDRYLLPLLPLCVLLLARGISVVYGCLAADFGRKGAWLFGAGLLLLLLLPAWNARHGRYPVGGQAAADQGAAEIAAVLQAAPYGTVLYDHWYSWQWRYHLFNSGVYVSWFPDGASLAEELAVFGRQGAGRYLVLPETAVARPMVRAVQAAGFTLQPVHKAGNITLYQIIPEEVTVDP